MEKNNFELIFCQVLDIDLNLTQERREHIIRRHPEFRSLERELFETVLLPDFILKKPTEECLLVKWHSSIFNGKFMVVVAKLDVSRSWIITAYLSRTKPTGELL